MKRSARNRVRPTLRKLGAELRARRKHCGLSQEELAGQAKLSTTVVRRIEAGLQNFEISTLFAIAEQLSTSLAELFVTAERQL